MPQTRSQSRARGRVQPYGKGDIRSFLVAMRNVAVQTAPSIAASFAETYTGTGSRHKHSNVHYAPFGDSVSAFKSVQRKEQPKRFLEQNQYIRYRNLIGNLRPAANFQESASIIGIYETSDLKAIIEADPTGPTGGAAMAADSNNLTLDYLFKRALVKVLFANVGAFTAHVTLYNIRARDVAFSASDLSPFASWAEGMDQVAVGTTDEVIWGMEPTDVDRFNHHYEILNRESFSLRPGEEHAHTWSIIANKVVKGEEFYPTVTGPHPGLTNFIMVRSFGQLVTENSNDTEVGIGPAKVNWGAYIKYFSKSAPGQVRSKINFATSVLSDVAVPVVVGKQSQVEQGAITL